MTTQATTQTQPPPRPSLVRKLAEVMAEVERVAKSGRNEFHRYDYATEADIVAAVRGGMAKRGLLLVPSVRSTEWREVARAKGGADRLCTLTVRFTVHDGDTGEVLEFDVLGEGQDAGDKATYKALTGATKYALLKLFLIPTGDDPEADEPQGRAPPARQQAAPKPPPAQAKPAPSPAQVQQAETVAEKAGGKVVSRPDALHERAKRLGLSRDQWRTIINRETSARRASEWTEDDMARMETVLAAEEARQAEAGGKHAQEGF